jgi:hypothetical protein
MTPLTPDSVASLSDSELRALVVDLIGEVRALRAENAALRAENEELKAANLALKAEVQSLRDEVARLKGLPPRPSTKASRPSGMEKKAGTAGRPPKRRRRGPKGDAKRVDREVTLKVEDVPAGSRFLGYHTILVRDLVVAPEVTLYRRARWRTPDGETLVAPLPAGVHGGFGPNLRRFLLAAHFQGQVTTERLSALLAGIGVEISKRQVVRLISADLDAFATEDRTVLEAGLATARWITVDDTGARHAGRDAYTTQIGDDRFTAFRTASARSRLAFLDLLRAGAPQYVVNDEALAMMRRMNLAGSFLERLAAEPGVFADEAAWHAHLDKLGLSQANITPDPVRVASEGAIWAAIRARGLLNDTVIVSDDAGRFRAGDHALCWVHAERLVHKLVPATKQQRQAVELVRSLIWWFYADLKAYKREPCPRRAAAMRARFDRIFRRQTGFKLLDRLLARLHRRKHELLRVLDRPEIPLHTNGSENDIRACVTKRKISGGTVSEAGREARDILLGLMKTCMKLGVSFYAYLGDRITGAGEVPQLADLVRQTARA